MCIALPSIGWIGLGPLGLPKAHDLCDAGYSVSVYDRTAADVETAKAFGAYAASSLKQVGERSDIVITALPHAEAVRAAMEKPDGFLANPKKSLVWIQLSPVDGDSNRFFAKEAAAHGVMFVGPVADASKEVLAYVRPILSRLGL